MDTLDWRAQLMPYFRQIQVNKIMSKLNHSLHDDDELIKVKKIAQSIEHKSYAEATSQVDYLRKISSILCLIDNNWRALLQPDSRQRIANKIMETLRRHLPVYGQEELDETRKIAARFEEEIYTVATSQSDYLRKISLKMLTMETQGQNTRANSMPSNSGDNRNGPSDTDYWRAQLHPDSRQRIVSKIMETLRGHLPVYGQEGLDEIRKIAARFEEKIYNVATSLSDYLRKISLKMLTMETRIQDTTANSMPSNSGDSRNGSSDTGLSEGERNSAIRKSP